MDPESRVMDKQHGAPPNKLIQIEEEQKEEVNALEGLVGMEQHAINHDDS